MKILLIFSILISSLYANTDNNIDSLLNKFKKESELSKLTKQDTAGVVTIITREDMEKINATSLKDILGQIPTLNITRKLTGEYALLTPGGGFFVSGNVRIYINNHELSSSYHEGALSIWANLPMEFIDHIEVYRGTTTIEFGNIPGILVIKLYTKDAAREDGGKVKLSSNKLKDAKLDVYYAYNKDSKTSAFAYVSKADFKNEKYNFNNKKQSNDHINNFLYLNGKINDISVEVAKYKIKTGFFLKSGQDKNTQINSHSFININKYFNNKDTRLQLTYDAIKYAKDISQSKIFAGAAGMVTQVEGYASDNEFMFELEKNIKLKLNDIIIGAFYKRKKFIVDVTLGTTPTYFSNTLDITSLYIQDKCKLSKNTVFVASLKSDNYSYDKKVKSTNQMISKVALITKMKNIMFKFFYTNTYQEVPTYQLYTLENKPYKSNENLKVPRMNIISSYIEYQNKKSLFSLEYMRNEVKNKVEFNEPPAGNGTFYNDPYKRILTWTVLKSEYKFNTNNKLIIAAFKGTNSRNKNFSPKTGITFSFFNKYNKFDLYNRITILSGYEMDGKTIGKSYNYDLNIKYNYSRDLSFTLNGINLLNKGYEQVYKNIPEAVTVQEQKVYLGMEYLF